MECITKRVGLALLAAAFIGTAPAIAQEEEGWWNNLEISGGITGVIQGTSGNNDPAGAPASGAVGSTDGSNFAYTADINIDAELAPGHSVHMHLETGEGDGIGNELPDGTLNPNYDPNNTANVNNQQSVTVSQAYYEGEFAEGMLILDVGKMDIHSLYDENDLAGDETSQFLNGIFARHTGAIMAELEDYYAFGARILIAPSENFDISVIGANPNNEKIGLDGFTAVQLAVRPSLEEGYEGSYRFYYVRDDSLHGGLTFTSTTTGNRKVNNSYGVSFDQMFAGAFGLFFRGTWQEDTVDENLYKAAYSGGLHLAGANWNRGEDHIGIGFGTMVGNDKSSAYVANIHNSDPTVVEAYYHLQVNDNFSITPDVQVLNYIPRTQKRDVTVLGVRGQFDF